MLDHVIFRSMSAMHVHNDTSGLHTACSKLALEMHHAQVMYGDRSAVG